MGKALSLMSRPFRNFNVENRAHKIIGQDKPTMAPKFEKDQQTYEELMRENPQAFQDAQVKHENLDNYLKQVYVQSHDSIISPRKAENPDKPLPLDRHQVDDFEFGIKQPATVPEGKVVLKNALKFITDHQNNPKLHTVEKIASDYSIPIDTTKNILKYYKVYELYVPETRKVKATFAGPSVPRIKIIPRPKKQLPSGEEKKTDK